MSTLIYFKVFLLACLSLLPFFKEKGFKFYNPICLLSVIYFIEFGVPSLYMTINPKVFWFYNFDGETINRGLTFILLVYLFFLAGFYAPQYNKNLKNIINFILKHLPNINTFSLRINNLPLVLIMLIFAGWISRIILIKLGIYLHVEAGDIELRLGGLRKYTQILFIGSLLPILALTLVFFEWLKQPARKPLLIISSLLLILEILYALPSGSKERVLMPIFLILILYSIKYKPPLLPTIFSVVFLLLFIFPFTTTYRLIYSGHIISDFQSALSIYINSFRGLNKNFVNELFFGIFGERFNYALIVSRIVEDTPRIWDFKLGSTYALFFISIIPRLLWPGKPDIAILGNDFGIDYGFISSYDFSTSVGMTWIGEMFINFGWWGILFAFFYGLFYQIIYRYFMRGGKLTALSTILYIFTLYYMLRGDMFAAQFGGLLKLYFVAFIVFLPFIKRVKISK